MITSRFWSILISGALFATMLLGDSRQHIVDVLVVGTAIVGCGVLLKKRQLFTLPPREAALWILVFITSLPFFSPDSLGPAPQSYVRYLFGFIVFAVSYSLSSAEMVTIVARALLVLGGATSLSSAAFLFFDRPGWLPTMNLLYPSYGHNHAVDLVIMVFPLVFYLAAKPVIARIFLWALFLMGIALSFARGAWVLLLGYVSVSGLLTRRPRRKQLYAAISIFLATLLVVGISLPAAQKNNPLAGTPLSRLASRMAGKGNILSDPRQEYWKQAITMFREKPVFGSGAGSFYFGSRRLQSKPSAYSWFAHSFVLQTLAEQGLWGGLPLILLVGLVSWKMLRYVLSHPPEQNVTSRLAIGALLAVLYSFFEFNLSFAVIWVIFWGIAGIVLGADRESSIKAKNGMFVYPIVVLGIFYLLYTLQSIVLAFFPLQARLAFYLTPFDAGAAQYYLSSPSFVPGDMSTLLTFHKKDPETLLAVAATQERLEQREEALMTRERLLRLDPSLEENHAKYISLLSDMGRHEKIAEWLSVYPALLFPSIPNKSVIAAKLPTPLIRDMGGKLSELFDATKSHEVRYARFYYRVGLWYLMKQPEETRRFWNMATALDPSLSYFWIERAALETHVFHDDTNAMTALRDCMGNVFAGTHCKQTLYSHIPVPGHYEKEINK
jgi:O-antigen ligase